MKHAPAIAQLEVSLDVVETNERITRDDPAQAEQNELRRENARDYRAAIELLKRDEAVEA